ncbi:hypothetical protein OWR29_17830 [Actinoplanes sp. Pm04-4]|uniref:Uncharacterized protein n=1 Tax=Paractinoplanes pyxinae TaxID=2997416 RepID=A0ABT4B064_9ACTN|nr:hypothetical protein [Actinoplanes pyxinae]MCY1139865.1 hypothetical protein [Actinoplanes pyxinae]
MAPHQTPSPSTGMVAPEFILLRRITTRPGPVSHSVDLRPGKQPELPHKPLFRAEKIARKNDHAILRMRAAGAGTTEMAIPGDEDSGPTAIV